jgi:hypothetical protein
MSHVVVVGLKIKNLEALAEAAASCGLEYKPQENHWRWYARFLNDWHGDNAAYKHGIDPKRYGTADAGILYNKDGKYDAGVYKVGEGEYTIVYDFYNGGEGLVKKLSGIQSEADLKAGKDTGDGKNANKLMVEYTKAVCLKNPALNGRNVTVTRLDDGRHVIRATEKVARLG